MAVALPTSGNGTDGPGTFAPTDVRSSELTDIDLSTWHNEIPPEWSIAMPLQRGEVKGYDFDRMTVEFHDAQSGQGNYVRDQYRGDGLY
jgi:hypothetical protein